MSTPTVIEVIVEEISVEVVTGLEGPPGPGGGGGASDHGALGGLADDDHAQYHTDARGDARYSQLGHDHSGVYDPAGTAATAVSDHEAAADPHTGYQRESEKGSAGGYASLDGGGQIPAAQIPAVAITEYLGESADQTAMLAQSGQYGDWTVRTDSGTVFVITGADPSILAGWTELVYPGAPVSSVAGRTGAVTLTSSDLTDTTAAGRALLDDADATAQRTTLGAQAALISGTNIKTVNSASLLGSGDLVVSASPAGSANTLQRNNAGVFAEATGVTWTGNQLLVTAQAAATTPCVVRGAASHSANLQSWQNSAASVLASVNASGQFAGNKYLAMSPSQGGIDFLSGYTRLLGYDGKIAIAVDASTGVPVHIYGVGFGPNYFTTDGLLTRVAAAIIGVRGATSSAAGALNFIEQSTPATPAAGSYTIYADNSGGKTRAMILFASGAAQQVAIQP